jgi:hypothetical protein
VLPRSRDLLDDVDLPRHVVAPPPGHLDLDHSVHVIADTEAERPKEIGDLAVSEVDAQQPLDPRNTQ